jgi:hypothetical protein
MYRKVSNSHHSYITNLYVVSKLFGHHRDSGETHKEVGGASKDPPELKPTKLSGCYVPIGMSIEQQEHSTIVRQDRHDGQYQYRRQSIPCWEVVRRLLDRGGQLIGTFDGWIRIQLPSTTRRSARSTRSVPSGAASLHLINNRKPPIGFKWLDRYLTELFSCPNLMQCEGGV